MSSDIYNAVVRVLHAHGKELNGPDACGLYAVRDSIYNSDGVKQVRLAPDPCEYKYTWNDVVEITIVLVNEDIHAQDEQERDME